MTKDQIWELLEIYRLLQVTDRSENEYGFNLFTEFLERHVFKVGE